MESERDQLCVAVRWLYWRCAVVDARLCVVDAALAATLQCKKHISRVLRTVREYLHNAAAALWINNDSVAHNACC